MESLTDKEVTVLELMAQGEDMLAIGNWKPIIESLVAKGYARLLRDKWHRATPEGVFAFVAFENNQFRKMVSEHNQTVEQKTEEPPCLP